MQRAVRNGAVMRVADTADGSCRVTADEMNLD